MATPLANGVELRVAAQGLAYLFVDFVRSWFNGHRVGGYELQ
jgi:hypothetical protein